MLRQRPSQIILTPEDVESALNRRIYVYLAHIARSGLATREVEGETPPLMCPDSLQVPASDRASEDVPDISRLQISSELIAPEIAGLVQPRSSSAIRETRSFSPPSLATPTWENSSFGSLSSPIASPPRSPPLLSSAYTQYKHFSSPPAPIYAPRLAPKADLDHHNPSPLVLDRLRRTSTKALTPVRRVIQPSERYLASLSPLRQSAPSERPNKQDHKVLGPFSPNTRMESNNEIDQGPQDTHSPSHTLYLESYFCYSGEIRIREASPPSATNSEAQGLSLRALPNRSPRNYGIEVLDLTLEDVESSHRPTHQGNEDDADDHQTASGDDGNQQPPSGGDNSVQTPTDDRASEGPSQEFHQQVNNGTGHGSPERHENETVSTRFSVMPTVPSNSALHHEQRSQLYTRSASTPNLGRPTLDQVAEIQTDRNPEDEPRIILTRPLYQPAPNRRAPHSAMHAIANNTMSPLDSLALELVSHSIALEDGARSSPPVLTHSEEAQSQAADMTAGGMDRERSARQRQAGRGPTNGFFNDEETLTGGSSAARWGTVQTGGGYEPRPSSRPRVASAPRRRNHHTTENGRPMTGNIHHATINGSFGSQGVPTNIPTDLVNTGRAAQPMPTIHTELSVPQGTNRFEHANLQPIWLTVPNRAVADVQATLQAQPHLVDTHAYQRRARTHQAPHPDGRLGNATMTRGPIEHGNAAQGRHRRARPPRVPLTRPPMPDHRAARDPTFDSREHGSIQARHPPPRPAPAPELDAEEPALVQNGVNGMNSALGVRQTVINEAAISAVPQPNGLDPNVFSLPIRGPRVRPGNHANGHRAERRLTSIDYDDDLPAVDTSIHPVFDFYGFNRAGANQDDSSNAPHLGQSHHANGSNHVGGSGRQSSHPARASNGINGLNSALLPGHTQGPNPTIGFPMTDGHRLNGHTETVSGFPVDIPPAQPRAVPPPLPPRPRATQDDQENDEGVVQEAMRAEREEQQRRRMGQSGDPHQMDDTPPRRSRYERLGDM